MVTNPCCQPSILITGKFKCHITVQIERNAAARVRDYQPAMLDELLAAGEVTWSGAGAISGSDADVQPA